LKFSISSNSACDRRWFITRNEWRMQSSVKVYSVKPLRHKICGLCYGKKYTLLSKNHGNW